MARARILYAGSPDFAVPALQRLLASGHNVIGVLTQPDKPAGRGRKLTPCPVKVAATEAGLKVLQPQTLRDSVVQAQLRALAPDLFVVAAYGQLLPPEVLVIPRRGCVNLHASLLPRWRGAAPIQTAILAGDTETGVCLTQMEAGLDTGPVFARVTVPIGPADTGGSLHNTLAEVGADLLGANLEALLTGALTPVPQPPEGVTYAPRIAKADGRIDWHATAAAIDGRIRAFNPWPVAHTTLHGEPLRCWMSALPAAAAAEAAAEPGRVLGLAGDALRVQTGSGELLLQVVQAAGRKQVSGREFANAHAIDDLLLGDS